MLAAERDSSAAARDEAAAEYALELEVCTDVPARKQFFWFTPAHSHRARSFPCVCTWALVFFTASIYLISHAS